MKAIVLAGGRGVRLRPLTDTKPKALVHIAGAPVLEHLIRNASAAGVGEFLIALGYLGEQIRSCFRDGAKLGVKIGYFHPEGKGVEGVLFSALAHLDDEDFCCFCGDTVLRPDQIETLRRAHARRAALATFILDNEDRVNPKRVRVDRAGRILGASRTPADGVLTYNMCIHRMWLAGTCALLQDRNEQSLALAMDELLATVSTEDASRSGDETASLCVCDVGEWVNINYPDDLIRAERFLAGNNAQGVVSR